MLQADLLEQGAEVSLVRLPGVAPLTMRPDTVVTHAQPLLHHIFSFSRPSYAYYTGRARSDVQSQYSYARQAFGADSSALRTTRGPFSVPTQPARVIAGQRCEDSSVFQDASGNMARAGGTVLRNRSIEHTEMLSTDLDAHRLEALHCNGGPLRLPACSQHRAEDASWRCPPTGSTWSFTQIGRLTVRHIIGLSASVNPPPVEGDQKRFSGC